MTINRRVQERSLQKKPDNDDNDSVFVKMVAYQRRSLATRLNYVKSVRWSYSGPYFSVFGLNTDHNNSEYRHFLRSVEDHI